VFSICRRKFFKTAKGFPYGGSISHPFGNILIDTGIGKNIDSQYESTPTWLKPFFTYEKKIPVSEILFSKKIKIESILLSHMHWDHASGLKDLKDVIFHTTKEDIGIFVNLSPEKRFFFTGDLTWR